MPLDLPPVGKLWQPPKPAITRAADTRLLDPGYLPVTRDEKRAALRELVKTHRITPQQAREAIVFAIKGDKLAALTMLSRTTMVRSRRGEAPFPVNAVDYNGSSQFLIKSGSLTGLASSKVGLVSFWCRLDGGNGSILSIFAEGFGNFAVERGGGTNKFTVYGSDSGLTPALNIATSNAYTSGAAWHHVAMSWNLASAGSGRIYVNGASDYAETTYANANIDFSSYTHDWTVAAGSSGFASFFNGCLAEFYFTTQYLDLSVAANLQKFRSPSGKPVDLGANGSTPTGTQPLIYLKNPAASVGTNSGSSSTFTATGTPTVASTSPSD